MLRDGWTGSSSVFLCGQHLAHFCRRLCGLCLPEIAVNLVLGGRAVKIVGQVDVGGEVDVGGLLALFYKGLNFLCIEAQLCAQSVDFLLRGSQLLIIR